MRVFPEHFSKVLYKHKNTDDNFINDILLREVMTELDKVPIWEEIMNAVSELTNYNAPGLNNAPLNAFKTMSETNLLRHFKFILELCEYRLDYV